jgi:excisionase family DNA binding protein
MASLSKWQTRELMTVEQVATYLSKSHEAARKWLKRSGLPLARAGQKLMVDRRDLDRAIGVR